MNFHVLTLFPEMIRNGMNTSITGRAIAAGYLSIEAVNIRDFAFILPMSQWYSVSGKGQELFILLPKARCLIRK